MSLIKRWGLGVDLVFNARDAVNQMVRVHQSVVRLRGELQAVGSSVANFAGKLGQLGMVMAPLAAAFGLAVGTGSKLAADLEAQSLTMRILIGDAGKANQLLEMIRVNAASTPFEEGDLIEGSKRLLRLTGSNIDQNMELLKTMETMAALSPGKSVVDAVEALLDATSGGGFERLKEFGVSLRADDFKAAGPAGSAAWADAVIRELTTRMTTITRGEDLVGALSQTFLGRVSTLGDAAKALLRDLGQVFNREVGPLLEPITARLAGLAPAVRQAAEGLTGTIRGLVSRAQPWIDRILGWWDGLGVEGQARIFQPPLGLGAPSAVLVPVGGALGAVVFGVVSLVGAVSAAWPVISSIGGALLAALAPEILLPLAAGLATVATLAFAAWAALARDGEGPVDTLRRVGAAVWAFLVEAFDRARVAWSQFAAGFGATWSGIEGPFQRLQTALDPITTKVAQLFALFAGPDGEAARTLFRWMGVAAGFLADMLVNKVVAGLELVAAGIDIVASVFRPMVLSFNSFYEGLLGLVTGSMTAEKAIIKMLMGVTGLIVGMVNTVFQLLAGAVELLIRSIVLSLSGLPGMEGLLSSTGNLGADAISRARAAFEQETSNAIAGVNLARDRAQAAQADRAAPVVNVAPTVENKVAVSTSVKLDTREMAKATGAATTRRKQREGQPMPAQARGRVLRGGTIEDLDPAAVW